MALLPTELYRVKIVYIAMYERLGLKVLNAMVG